MKADEGRRLIPTIRAGQLTPMNTALALAYIAIVATAECGVDFDLDYPVT
jgi:hypothetical protein